jgi:hypothetical protein
MEIAAKVPAGHPYNAKDREGEKINPKSEIRNPKQIQNTKAQNPKQK